MDFLRRVDTISMELSILYFKDFPVKISLKSHISLLEYCLNLAKSADPDEMLPYATFHLGLHCLSKYLFTSIQNVKEYIGPVKHKMSA